MSTTGTATTALSSMEKPPHSRISFITPSTLIAFLLFAFATLTIGITALPRAGRLYDFRAFYSAGWLLLHNPHQLFSLSTQEAVQNAVVIPMWRGVPFYHPAYEALLYAPLTLLSYRHAYIVYAVANLLLLALCYRLAPLAADPRIAKVPRPLLFFLAFPCFMAIAEGQDSIVFLLLMCLLWRALSSARDRAAGMLLALALFKLQIALGLLFFLALYLPAERRKRILLSFAPAAAAVGLACVLITGLHGTAEWFRLLGSASVASHLTHHAQAVIAVYPKAMPTLNGLLFVCGGRLLPPRASLALVAILSALVLVAAASVCRTARSLPVAFCEGLAASLLLSPHLFLYDYVLLLFPILLLRQPGQTLFAALFYVLNYVLFALGGIDWFALMSVVPLFLIATLLLQRPWIKAAQSTQSEVNPLAAL